MGRIILATIGLILMGATQSFAQQPNLKDAELVGLPQDCHFDGKPMVCMLFKKNSKHYQVVIDQHGEYAFYEVGVHVTETMTFVINPKLLWHRKAI